MSIKLKAEAAVSAGRVSGEVFDNTEKAGLTSVKLSAAMTSRERQHGPGLTHALFFNLLGREQFARTAIADAVALPPSIGLRGKKDQHDLTVGVERNLLTSVPVTAMTSPVENENSSAEVAA